jgi:hypothetical protein
MLTNQDLQQIAQKGITPEQIDVQLKEFETGFPFLRLEAAASIGHGIVAPDEAERKQYIDENEELTDDQRKEFLEDMPGWEYDFSLTKTSETDRYVIFLSEDFVFSGGAHGGIIGCGPLTFDKKDGHLVEKFLEESALQEMQPLLRKGLVQYYSSFGQEIQPEQLDENLMLSGDVIPFPAWEPIPTPEGLTFTYQQYEIASYADGMPSFTLPYDEVLPFLTEDAKKLIGK